MDIYEVTVWTDDGEPVSHCCDSKETAIRCARSLYLKFHNPDNYSSQEDKADVNQEIFIFLCELLDFATSDEVNFTCSVNCDIDCIPLITMENLPD